MEIQRYDVYTGATGHYVSKDIDGDWCKYEDVEALEKYIIQLEHDVEEHDVDST